MVSRILCRVDSAAFDTDRYHIPTTPAQAKFSMAFCVAKVVVSGGVTVSDFIGDEIADRAALAFSEKVEILCCPDLFTDSRYGAEVQVEIRDGRVCRKRSVLPGAIPVFP